MRRFFGVAVITVTVVVVVSGLGPTGTRQPESAKETIAQGLIDTSAAIDVFSQRVKGSPRDAASAVVLGQLRVRRFRETGDIGELERAEYALEQALAVVPGYPQALATLAQVDLGLHRFDDALANARIAAAKDPTTGALVTAADALVALGRYDEAETLYIEAQTDFASAELSARLAHLEMIEGELESALLTMRRAAEVYFGSGGSGETAAWFLTRVGDLEIAAGQYEDAEMSYRASLEVFPGYYLGLAGLSRATAARGEIEEAIEAYEAALAVRPLPETLSAVGDLYLLNGQPDMAADSFAIIDTVAALSGGVYDRSVALHYADHGRADAALPIAEAGIETLPDVYGYDILAWALYRQGYHVAALAAAEKATSRGTAEARLWYHLGAIRLAVGNRDGAIEALEHALSLSPRFDPMGAADAVRLLEEARA
jgi:tetratricopeptide (TPR) repeat protein